jgi:hypothetical protein
MASLLAFAEDTLDTDFAMLGVLQPEPNDVALSGLLIATLPGMVAVTCGQKYARCHVRLERWSSRPPALANFWEEWDEWPWATSPTRPPLVQPAGFDPPQPNDPALPLGDLQAGRVAVAAWGRTRHGYTDHTEPSEPERYLFRFWPEHSTGLDEVDREPRRVRTRYDRRNEFISDLAHLAFWSPLNVTPASLARRFALDEDFVLRALNGELAHRQAHGGGELWGLGAPITSRSELRLVPPAQLHDS